MYNDLINLTEEDYKKVGLKKIFPLKPGCLVPAYLDKRLKILLMIK